MSKSTVHYCPAAYKRGVSLWGCGCGFFSVCLNCGRNYVTCHPWSSAGWKCLYGPGLARLPTSVDYIVYLMPEVDP